MFAFPFVFISSEFVFVVVGCGLLLEYSTRGRTDSVRVVSNNSSTPCSPLLHRGGTRTAVTHRTGHTDRRRPHCATTWPDSRPAVTHAPACTSPFYSCTYYYTIYYISLYILWLYIGLYFALHVLVLSYTSASVYVFQLRTMLISCLSY